MNGQGEFLPHTFSSVNISTNYHTAEGMTNYGARIGYTNKKVFSFSIGGTYSDLDNNSAYRNINELYLVPRLEVYGGQSVITKLGIEYGVGKSTGNNMVSDAVVDESNAYAAGGLSFSIAIGSRKGFAIFPTVSANLSNRKFEMGGTPYFENLKEPLVDNFHQDLSISFPLLLNFESTQIVVIPKMGSAVYGNYYELGVSLNLYHSARCKVVRHKIKKSDVLSKFYN